MTDMRLVVLVCLLLAVLTFVSYWPALDCGFINFDDNLYVTENRWVQAGPTAESIEWAFTRTHASNWHPLTWISHMLDYRFYGMNPRGHHLTNLILHILGTLALFLLIRRLTGSVWRSAFVAALFAVHPLHVESVAWVSERKDVLSTLFWFLTMHAYINYVRRPGSVRYVLTLGVFALGLMAKPMLVTLPLVLLLIDYWPLSRLASEKTSQVFTAKRLLLEKAPFFAISAASCIMTYFAQRWGESVATVDAVPIGTRIANALVSYSAYLAKMFWPAKLAMIYPYPNHGIRVWQVLGSVTLLAGISVLAMRLRRARPWLAVGWLWYIVTLVPVIGLVQVGGQSMADRYTYVPLIGVFLALTWLGAEGLSRLRTVGTSAAVIIVLLCSVLTWRQAGYWTSSITLFSHAVRVTERNHIAHTNLGSALAKEGRHAEALEHHKSALRIKGSARHYNNVGAVLMEMGRLDEAVSYYETAIRLKPDYAKAHFNLGYVHHRKRRYAEAAAMFEEAVRLRAEDADAHYYLGQALSQTSRADDAVSHYRRATELNPRMYLAHFNLGVLLRERGDFDGAVKRFRSAIRIEPTYFRAHHNLGAALDDLGKPEEAMKAYREAIRLKPDLGEAHNNLAIDLYTAGRYSEAWDEVRLARKYGVEPHPEFIEALSRKSR